MTAKIEEQLQEIGLSEKEAACYLALLRHGTKPTSFIAGKAGLNRGTAYLALHSLLSKGFVTKSARRGVQIFSPQNPKHILDFLMHREEQIKKQRDSVGEVVGQLLSIMHPATTRPRFQFYEGVEGAKLALEETLGSKDKLLRAYISLQDIADFLSPEFFDEYTARRIKMGYTLRAIRTFEKDRLAAAKHPATSRYVTRKSERREVRYLSDDIAFPITIYLYDQKLTAVSSKDEGFALTIESSELSSLQKNLFDVIWQTLEASKS